MNELTKEEAIELAKMIDELMQVDTNGMYRGQGKQWYCEFARQIYAHGFKIIKEE